jgi:hypothetical protein
MSYIAWDNNGTSSTVTYTSSQGTTSSSYEADKSLGRFLSPVYIDTQTIFSFSNSSNLEFVYFNDTGFIQSTVSVGAFSDPYVLTTVTTESTKTITVGSYTGGTEIPSKGTYSGVFRTFQPSAYGRIEDVSIISSYAITASTNNFTQYSTSFNFIISSYQEGGGQTETGSIEASPITAESSSTIFPTFFDSGGINPLYTSSSNNRSWGKNDIDIRLYNASSIPDSTLSTYEASTTTSTSSVFSYVTFIDNVTIPTSSGQSTDISSTGVGVNFRTTNPIIGANLNLKYKSDSFDANWVFWNTNGSLTRVHAFISPIILGSYNIENIGVASHQKGNVFFADINKGDALVPQTRYSEAAWELANGLGISLNGISATWNIPKSTTNTSLSQSGWTMTTTANTFQTKYSVSSSSTTVLSSGNAQIPYPQNSTGGFPQNSTGGFEISINWSGVFGATTYDETSFTSNIFTASTNSSTTGSSTIITLQSNQTFQIITDGFWMNPDSYTAIL